MRGGDLGYKKNLEEKGKGGDRIKVSRLARFSKKRTFTGALELHVLPTDAVAMKTVG